MAHLVLCCRLCRMQLLGWWWGRGGGLMLGHWYRGWARRDGVCVEGVPLPEGVRGMEGERDRLPGGAAALQAAGPFTPPPAERVAAWQGAGPGADLRARGGGAAHKAALRTGRLPSEE